MELTKTNKFSVSAVAVVLFLITFILGRVVMRLLSSKDERKEKKQHGIDKNI